MLVENLTQEDFFLGAFSFRFYAVFFGWGRGRVLVCSFHTTDIFEKLSKSELCKSSHFRNTMINYFVIMKDYVY